MDQVAGTAILVALIFAIIDPRNVAPPGWLGPILFGGLVVAIGMCFGFNAGYAINPARDLGPRLFTFVGGWGGEVFRAGNGWWWVPIVGPLVGRAARRLALRPAHRAPPSGGVGGEGGGMSGRFVLALDQGTTSSRAIVFGHDGRVGRRRRSRSSRRSSRARATSSTTRRRSGRRRSRWRGQALGRAGARPRGHRRPRHHQPARDHDPLGPRTPASRWPTRSSGRAGSARPSASA